MSSTWAKIDATINRMSAFLSYLGWVAVAVTLLATTYDVIMRYVFRRPTSWAVEMTAILLVYTTFLCAPALVRKRQHISMDILLTRLSVKGQKYFDILISLIVILFCMIMVWLGMEATFVTYQYDMYTPGRFHVLYWPIYVSIPLGFLFVGLEYLFSIIEMIKEGKDVH